jgi:hypothetical protein
MLRDASLIVYCAPMELSKVLARGIYKHFIPTGFTLIKIMFKEGRPLPHREITAGFSRTIELPISLRSPMALSIIRALSIGEKR